MLERCDVDSIDYLLDPFWYALFVVKAWISIHTQHLSKMCAGNLPVTGAFPRKGQWCGGSMFSLICTWTHSGVNNQDAGNFRCHRADYDVTVMMDIINHPWPNFDTGLDNLC